MSDGRPRGMDDRQAEQGGRLLVCRLSDRLVRIHDAHRTGIIPPVALE
jgi:hypothetical protein